jgi:hypothetical protein
MMMLSEAHSRTAEGELRDEIGRVEAFLVAGEVGSIGQETTGRVVGKAVVRAMAAAISFLRAPQQTVSLLTLRSSVRVARRVARLASRAAGDGERQIELMLRSAAAPPGKNPRPARSQRRARLDRGPSPS